jgi:hypothetical protein
MSEQSMSSMKSAIEKEAQTLITANKQHNQEKIMLDRALHLYGICYSSDRPREVMRNCVRIAMHELGDNFNLEVIRGCNAMDITVSEYIDSQANYLLKNYYSL